MRKVEKNIIKKFSILCAILLLGAFLIGCSSSADVKGTYIVESVTPVKHTKAILNFDAHWHGNYEIRLESGKATASYIYFTDIGGNNIYQTQSGPTVTTWKVKGKKITLEGSLGVGTTDIEVREGWLLLTYRIEGEAIYVAEYKKTT